MTVLPVRLIVPLLMPPDRDSVLAAVLLTSNVPFTVIGAEITSPRLVGNSMSVAGGPALSNVKVPPPAAIVNIPPPDPMLKEPTVIPWFKLIVWLPKIAELTVAGDPAPFGKAGPSIQLPLTFQL